MHYPQNLHEKMKSELFVFLSDVFLAASRVFFCLGIPLSLAPCSSTFNFFADYFAFPPDYCIFATAKQEKDVQLPLCRGGGWRLGSDALKKTVCPRAAETYLLKKH